MATPDQVRQYLAYWFQLGKKMLINNGRDALLPRPVVQGDRYSDEFEACWRLVIESHAGDCYLEGTSQTIAELLSSAWALHPCARCEMPVPTPDLGMLKEASCPCADLPFWPDSDHPKPRLPISNHDQLSQIRDRLLGAGQRATHHSDSSNTN